MIDNMSNGCFMRYVIVFIFILKFIYFEGLIESFFLCNCYFFVVRLIFLGKSV